jgi:hypothetical protein
MTPPHGIHDETIINFAIQITQLVSYPTSTTYSQTALTALLQIAAYLVKYQKCVRGEITESRYFIPQPMEETFTEIEEEIVRRDHDEHGRKWRDSMRYLKLKCERHQGPFFICRIVQREEVPNRPMESNIPAVKNIDLQDKVSDQDVEE